MEMVEVAKLGFQDDAGILESILHAENIPYFLSNENMSVFAPAISRSLMVVKQDKERAVGIIKEAGFGKYLTE
ncbi:MAG: DUF2007 domain-containing protein [Dysgonamonadaceae bacterium]|jgi:hypothetical protein|nr:DUF2007 domain-containing protein [Dysgonamonadaceae bacterium]